MRKKQIDQDAVLYSLWSCVLAILSVCLKEVVTGAVIRSGWGVVGIIFDVLIGIGCIYVLPLTLLLWKFRDTIADRYVPSENPRLWIKYAGKLFLPGELARLVLLIFPAEIFINSLVFVNRVFIFGYPGKVLYDITYGQYSGRFLDTMYETGVTIGEFILIVLCYIVAMLPYWFVLFRGFFKIWNVEKERIENNRPRDCKVVRNRSSKKVRVVRKEKPERKRREFTVKLQDDVKSMLLNAWYVLVEFVLIGMASNVIILLFGTLFSVIGIKYGFTPGNTRSIRLAIVVITLLACMSAIIVFAKLIGHSDVDRRQASGIKLKFSAKDMAVFCTIGGIGFAILCFIFSWPSMSRLFFAGPVPQIAELFSREESSFGVNAQSFSLDITIGAILICTIIFIISAMIGYVVGFRERVEEIHEAARVDAREYVSESRREYQTESCVSSAFEKTEEKMKTDEEIFREKLDRRTEEFYIRLNKKKKQFYITLTVVIWLVDILMWVLWAMSSEEGFFSPSAAFFTMGLMLPFWPFKVHDKIFGKNYYAEVLEMRAETVYAIRGGAYMRAGRPTQGRGVSVKTEEVLLLKGEDGVSFTLKLPGGCETKYKKGEYVYKLSAYPYPVKCSLSSSYVCPKCSREIDKKQKQCYNCKTKVP